MRFQVELAAHQKRCLAQQNPDDGTCDADLVLCAQDVLKPQAIALASSTASAAKVNVTVSGGGIAVVTVRNSADGWKVGRVKCALAGNCDSCRNYRPTSATPRE